MLPGASDGRPAGGRPNPVPRLQRPETTRVTSMLVAATGPDADPCPADVRTRTHAPGTTSAADAGTRFDITVVAVQVTAVWRLPS
jgi:hypothetical protein